MTATELDAPREGGAADPAEGDRRLADLLLPLLAFLLPTAYHPLLNGSYWAPKAALLLLSAGPGAVALARQSRHDRVARAGSVFLVVALLSTLASGHVALSLVGPYNWGNGWLFLLAVVGCWALARELTATGRRRLELALVATVVVNAAMAWIAATTSFLGSTVLDDRPWGLTGNPVHLTALCSAGMVLVGARARPDRRWLAAVGLVAGAVELAGGRSGFLLLPVAVGWLLWRHRRAALAPAAAALAGFAVAIVASNHHGALQRTLAEQAGDHGSRLAIWSSAWSAFLHRPVLGAGPGRFDAATRAFRPLDSLCIDFTWNDGHNLVMHQLATIGLVGTAALALWAWRAGRLARGPLACFALVAVLASLLEPFAVAVGPLAALALGAAAPLGPASRRSGLGRWLTRLTTIVGLVLTACLLIGDAAYRTARLEFDRPALLVADRYLPPWPAIALTGGRVEATDDRVALAWVDEAVRRDPDDAVSWRVEGDFEHNFAHDADASWVAFSRALDLDPSSHLAASGLRALAAETGRAVPLAAQRVLDRAPCPPLGSPKLFP